MSITPLFDAGRRKWAMGATVIMLVQGAIEYGGVAARDILLDVKQQVTSISSGTLIIGAAVLLGLVWLVKKM